jgi:hypothetical protein
MMAALLRERISPIREMPPPYGSFDYRPKPMPCQHPDIEPLKTDINSLILLARSFEIRLDSMDEQWKRQFKQNALLLERVSDLKFRMDKLDAEKFVVARRVATCKFSMVCVVLCAIIVWVLHEYLEYPHIEATLRTLT